jgi:hypothetical protein
MKLKLLLFTLYLSAGILNAQDTIRSLVITEVRLSDQGNNYIEITNMGDQPVNMKDFKLGTIRPWAQAINDVFNDPWVPEGNSRYIMLPDYVLQPGKSWVTTTGYDYGPEQYAKKIPTWEGSQEKTMKTQMYSIADLVIHVGESSTNDPTDSISRNAGGVDISYLFENWGGRECMFLEHHLSDVDSVVVDQVGGIFDESGKNRTSGMYDVAGVTGATGNSILVRKFSVKKGNPDFANARGVGADDSEWIPIKWPSGWGQWRDAWWTVGNHGNYKLDETTLESEIADVDFAGKTITVPWGTRRGDGVMHLMKKKPGTAWMYNLNANYEDSLSFAAHTGDILTVVVCGQEGYSVDFNIIVTEPSADANVLVPVSSLNYPSTATQWWRDDNQEGMLTWPRITQHASGTDSITGQWYGIPYALRVDSLLKRLEKPSNANWEIVFADGVNRPDLKHGDKIKVTSQNGTIKEYFIEMQPMQPSHDGLLSAITWPDIPEQYKGIYGWTGDTIPGFGSTIYNYRVMVPSDVSGIPALVAKTSNLNAKVAVKRAVNLTGSLEDRTIKFTVTAEDDSVVNVYNIELVKEKDPANIQPYFAKPFLSEYVFQDQWNNGFIEICNPGNQPLDLSKYMFLHTGGSPVAGIQGNSGENNWRTRYYKYIPGYKWVDETQWAVTPGRAVQDLNVSPIIMPGDVFVAGQITSNSYAGFQNNKQGWWAYPQTDVFFNTADNPWNETYSPWGSAAHEWIGNTWYLFEILNDSITRGLKPANDPDDFELIETFGNGDGSAWRISGRTDIGSQRFSIMRKPDFTTGKPVFKESFGTNAADGEWIVQGSNDRKNLGYPSNLQGNGATLDLGKHFFNPPTFYKSTVTSPVYKVSEGYSMNESIKGMKTGTTVSDFLGSLIKANDKQTLKVMRGGTTELSMDAALLMNDVLEVISADSTNTTKYKLDVNEEGLSSNAVLTSARYTVTIEQQPKSASEASAEAGTGTVKGFDYGTAMRTILANITLPAGASMSVIDGNGAYVPLKMLNFDTAYVNVTVNSNIYLNVVAENGVTAINYQLLPSTSESDAFLLSDVYNIIQKELLIQYVPRGTRVSAFVSNLVPSGNATMKLVNKMGQERLDGDVADDDKVVVTSANGQVTKTYYISKLSTAATPVTTYLAYILSNVYGIDQVAYKVAGVAGTETVSAFLAKVSAAPGATAYVVNKDGAVKTTGDIDGSDMVKVVSADGKMNVYYTFGPLTSADVLQANDIQLYPNPTNGEINVSGLKAGYRVQVYNSVGAAIRDINVQSSIERISLRNQPAGMYMIVVSDNNNMLGRYKVMKQ